MKYEAQNRGRRGQAATTTIIVTLLIGIAALVVVTGQTRRGACVLKAITKCLDGEAFDMGS